jgi:chemotaxis signal transduction protein
MTGLTQASNAARAKRQQRRESVILFSIANSLFAIAADAVHEIRSADSLAGSAVELASSPVQKVTHTAERAQRLYYVLSGCAHFGLPRTRPVMVLMLRDVPAAVLVDEIGNMSEVPAVHPLPQAYTGDERNWYRGLAYVRERVIPVVNPLGFLTAEELARLDAATRTVASV